MQSSLSATIGRVPGQYVVHAYQLMLAAARNRPVFVDDVFQHLLSIPLPTLG